jgi:hypothetical protein
VGPEVLRCMRPDQSKLPPPATGNMWPQLTCPSLMVLIKLVSNQIRKQQHLRTSRETKFRQILATKKLSKCRDRIDLWMLDKVTITCCNLTGSSIDLNKKCGPQPGFELRPKAMGGSEHMSFTMAALLVSGGTYAFMRKGSKVSLVAGCGVGALFAGSG